MFKGQIDVGHIVNVLLGIFAMAVAYGVWLSNKKSKSEKVDREEFDELKEKYRKLNIKVNALIRNQKKNTF